MTAESDAQHTLEHHCGLEEQRLRRAAKSLREQADALDKGADVLSAAAARIRMLESAVDADLKREGWNLKLANVSHETR